MSRTGCPPLGNQVLSKIVFLGVLGVSAVKNISAAAAKSLPLQQQTRHIIMLWSVPHEPVQVRQQPAE